MQSCLGGAVRVGTTGYGGQLNIEDHVNPVCVHIVGLSVPEHLDFWEAEGDGSVS